MRLRRLDLTRYGRFTDHSIDFGDAPAPGTPDLHLIYGPNEAGKSTTQSAWLDLLFGIPIKSPYGFRHPYDTMRIAALLETQSGPRHLVRLKRNRASLLDGEDRPLPDTTLQPDLAGLDRATYQAMFCLDDDTLEAGGKSILESRGELGQLLFAASAGLADLSRTLTSLRDEADRFHKPNTRKGTLADLKSQAADLKAELTRLDTTAADHARLAAANTQAHTAHTAARTALTAQRTRLAALARQLAALPHLATLHRLRADLAAGPDLPIPPATWAETLPALLRSETRLATAAAEQDAELHSCIARRDALALDPAALALAPGRASLAELRARHTTAEVDIPARRSEQAAAQAAIAALLTRLDAPHSPAPEALLIPAPRAATLAALLRTRSGIARDLANARTEHATALQRLEDARKALPQAAAAPDSARHRLAAAAAALRNSDHDQRHRAATRAAETAARSLADHLAALRPWTGSADDLAAQTPPDAPRLAAWKSTRDAALRTQETLAAQRATFAAEATRLEATLAAVTAVLGVATDAEAAAIRAARETAWAAHRRALDPATAETFEAALRHDDLTADARQRHQAERARAHEIAQQSRINQAERDRLAAQHDATVARLAAQAAETAAAIAAGLPGLPPETAPDALALWLDRRAATLATRAALAQAEADRRDAAADATTLATALAAALTAAGDPTPPNADTPTDAPIDSGTLLARADAALTRDAALAAARTRLAEAESALAARARALQAAITDDQAWSAAWAEATAPCWFAAAPPDAVGGILAELPDLATLLAREADLAARIAAMRDDQARFAAALAPLATALGLDPAAAPLDLAAAIDARIAAAEATARRHAETTEDLARRQAARAALAAEQARHAEQADAMRRFFAAASLDDVAACLAAIATRTDLQSRATAAEAALCDALGTPTAVEAEAALAGADRDSLRAEHTTLAAEIETAATHTETLLAASLRAADALAAIGGDDAVARRAAERRTIELAIEAESARHIRLRVGILAAEMALRAYRDRHRSAMMARASDAFRTISRGAYTRLSAVPEKDSETLIAIAADGSSKRADDLSKGTRFQLYLALRAAGYAEFAATRRPVPFIADDIMETFDDLRAEETFRVLGDMARTGQVIYLTHHAHLCPIAASVVPNVRVHRLEG